MATRAGGGDGFREQVRESTDLAQLIGAYTPLRQTSPGRFSALCPFHAETAPSFHVDAGRGFFHCFGCKESGDAFAFLMKKEGLSFRESLERLAAAAGIPIPRRDPRKADRQERLRSASRKALAHFRRALRSPSGAAARAYLRRRGLSPAMIEEHGLGYASADWEGLRDSLARAGVAAPVMAEAGLVRRGERGHYDFFRNRLIVPIFDGQGRVAGFAGRSLGDDEPKYLNSPDSPIYRKRSVLYGWNHARRAIRQETSAVLCEGYFDCLSAWQAGIPRVVAVCGTALTPEHARQLKAQAREVILAFDGDEGGRRAILRGLPVLLEAGLGARVARLPPGRDPDEVIREDGGAAFRDLLRTAPGFVRFLVGEAHRKRRGRRGPSKAETAREVLEIIAAAPGALEREAWTQEAAGPLGFSLDTALEEVRRLRLRRPPTRAPEAPPAPPPRTEAPRTRVTEAERDLIRWAEEKPVEVAGILRSARRRDLSGLASADLLLEVKRAADAGAATAAGLLGPAAGTAGTGRMLSRMLKEPVPLHRGQTPQDCWDALRLRELKATLPGLRAALSDPGGDLEKAMRRLEKAVREINRLQEGPSGSRAPGRGKTAPFGAECGRAAPALRLKTDC